MSHPLFPVLALFIFAIVFGIAMLLASLRSTKTKDWKVITVSLAIFLIIMFALRHNGTAPQRWAIEKCKDSKLIVYETAFAHGFYEYSVHLSSELLSAIMDSSFKYVETNALRKYSDKKFAKYYVSDTSDKNCQSPLSIAISEWIAKKDQPVSGELPSLQKGQCIAVQFGNELESKYEYYSNTKNAFGGSGRRVSTKIVREIASKKVLAEWKGYSGSSMWGKFKSCEIMERDLPFRSALFGDGAPNSESDNKND